MGWMTNSAELLPMFWLLCLAVWGMVAAIRELLHRIACHQRQKLSTWQREAIMRPNGRGFDVLPMPDHRA